MHPVPKTSLSVPSTTLPTGVPTHSPLTEAHPIAGNPPGSNPKKRKPRKPKNPNTLQEAVVIPSSSLKGNASPAEKLKEASDLDAEMKTALLKNLEDFELRLEAVFDSSFSSEDRIKQIKTLTIEQKENAEFNDMLRKCSAQRETCETWTELQSEDKKELKKIVAALKEKSTYGDVVQALHDKAMADVALDCYFDEEDKLVKIIASRHIISMDGIAAAERADFDHWGSVALENFTKSFNILNNISSETLLTPEAEWMNTQLATACTRIADIRAHEANIYSNVSNTQNDKVRKYFATFTELENGQEAPSREALEAAFTLLELALPQGRKNYEATIGIYEKAINTLNTGINNKKLNEVEREDVRDQKKVLIIWQRLRNLYCLHTRLSKWTNC